jgi:hypothetical protein
MTRYAWTKAEVAAYHRRMQDLRDERYDYLDAPMGDPDPDADPGPYMDEPPTDPDEFAAECVEFGCHRYDPDDREPMGGDPLWRETLEGEER